MDKESGFLSDAIDSLDDVEVSALAMLALGAMDDAESGRTECLDALMPEGRSRRRYEVHPVLGGTIVLALGLATLLLFWFC